MTANKPHPSANPLHTDDPVALRYLMSDTLFDIGETDLDDADLADVNAEFTLAQETSKNQELTFLGKNQSGFLFVFHDQARPEQHRLPDPEMEAFEKILGALELKIDDIALINIASIQPNFSDLLSFFKPRKVIVLGTPLHLTGLHDLESQPALHQVFFKEKLSVLHSYSFNEMMDNVDRKRAFWSNMKLLIG